MTTLDQERILNWFGKLSLGKRISLMQRVMALVQAHMVFDFSVSKTTMSRQ